MITDIFFIDDDESFLLYARQACRKISEIGEIYMAKDGQEGLDLLERLLLTRARVPNVVFVDINMPRLNGFEFLMGLKGLREKFPEARNIHPIVMLTSSNETKDRDRAKELGAEKYFIKTFTLKDFRNLVQECVHDSNL